MHLSLPFKFCVIKEIGMAEEEEDKITFLGEALSKYENNSCFKSTISGEHS